MYVQEVRRDVAAPGQPWVDSLPRGGVAQGQSKRLIIAVSVVRVHPPLPGTTEREMAKSDNRPKITMACTECRHRNYTTVKNRLNDRDRIELKKYCRWCRGHTLHRETR